MIFLCIFNLKFKILLFENPTFELKKHSEKEWFCQWMYFLDDIPDFNTFFSFSPDVFLRPIHGDDPVFMHAKPFETGLDDQFYLNGIQ